MFILNMVFKTILFQYNKFRPVRHVRYNHQHQIQLCFVKNDVIDEKLTSNKQNIKTFLLACCLVIIERERTTIKILVDFLIRGKINGHCAN